MTRRTFIRRTTVTALGAVLALSSFTHEVHAQESGGSSHPHFWVKLTGAQNKAEDLNNFGNYGSYSVAGGVSDFKMDLAIIAYDGAPQGILMNDYADLASRGFCQDSWSIPVIVRARLWVQKYKWDFSPLPTGLPVWVTDGWALLAEHQENAQVDCSIRHPHLQECTGSTVPAHNPSSPNGWTITQSGTIAAHSGGNYDEHPVQGAMRLLIKVVVTGGILAPIFSVTAEADAIYNTNKGNAVYLQTATETLTFGFTAVKKGDFGPDCGVAPLPE